MSKKIATLVLTILTASGLYFAWTTRYPHQPQISKANITLDLQRLEQALFALKSKAEVQAFLQKHHLFSEKFLRATTPQEQARLANQLYTMIQDPSMQQLHQEVQRVFGSGKELQTQLKSAFQHLKHHYPDFSVPQVATFVTGMGTDLFVSQDLIVIGLDFFMGEGAKFRPANLPDYLLRGYQPTHIVPKICLLLSQAHTQTDITDTTLLADMLHYGKAYYFSKTMLPTVPDAILLDYTTVQMQDIEANRRIIWEHFVENELLYTTNHLIKNKYISDRPFVAELSPRCPGRVGRWLGWEIVKSYMKQHPRTDLPTLMDMTDTQTLFRTSRYKPN